jgi:hypothetical protein
MEATAVREFRVDVPDGALDDLRDAGNHFATWQEPEIFTRELRAAFKSLRRDS